MWKQTENKTLLWIISEKSINEKILSVATKKNKRNKNNVWREVTKSEKKSRGRKWMIW